MRKLATLIITLSIVLYACSEDSLNTADIKNEKFDLTERVVLNETTANVSNLFLNMGVTGVIVTKNSKSTLFEFETKKTFILNGNTINLSNYSVIFEDEMISLNSNRNLKLTLLNGQPYIIKPNHYGVINDDQDNFKSIEFNILMFFMKEMTTSKSLKIDTSYLLDNNLSQRVAGCSFWNTYYVYSTGGSRNVALANLKADDDVNGCTEIGGPDSSCIWENHGCVATQAYCC